MELDLFVGDIYGGDYKEGGFDKDIIAAMFSKVTMENAAEAKIESITKSFITMFAVSIGQFTDLLYKLHKLKHVIISSQKIRNPNFFL